MSAPGLTVAGMLRELDGPVPPDHRTPIFEAVSDALQPLYALIVETRGRNRGDGELSFAMLHLAARSVSDLLASAHLASHGYLQQAYGTMRPVLENCDLMELFAREPPEAGVWINHPEPGKAFRPAVVRQRLGSPAADAAEYGHLSEMGSHPRFAGSRLTGVMAVRADDHNDRRLLIRMGPFIPGRPSGVLVYMLLIQTMVRLGNKLRHLVLVSASVEREEWVDAYLASLKAAQRGMRLIQAEMPEVAEESGGAAAPDAVYGQMIAALEGKPDPSDTKQ